MGSRNQRTDHRVKTAIRATASSRDRKIEVQCLIRDGSASGCRLISSHIAELPRDILVSVDGLREAVPGRIVWREDRMAGVSFHWQEVSDADKRRTHRYDASIPARVTSRDRAFDAECLIIDASKSGCRICSSRAKSLPEEVFLRVDGISKPLIGQVVWRNDSEAGISLQFDGQARVEREVAIRSFDEDLRTMEEMNDIIFLEGNGHHPES